MSNKIIKTSDINPVDYFNRKHVQYVYDYMCTLTNIVPTSITSFTYILNKEDENKHMIVIENEMFVAKMKNGLGMDINEKYSPFMMIQKYKFKNRYEQTSYWVIHDLMKNKSNYIRVGFKYYKVITKVDRDDIIRVELPIHDKQTIIDDHGRNELDNIPKFDSFTMVPDNKSHTQVIGNNYNLYSKFSHKSCTKKEYKGDIGWYWSKTILEHIFGEDDIDFEKGIRYIKFLYALPKQILPILVLTSKERVTGKSTFVDWICILFGDNAVVVNPQDIANSFNGTYADKNIIAIEESRFEGTQTLEKLKALATQKKLTVNTKFVQQYSVPFYGKLIITSNDENKFSRVDDEEVRYWIRKIPTLKGKANHNILNDLVKEIPQFLYYLDNEVKMPDVTKSRMGFTPDEIITDALITVKRESLPSLHKEIIELLDEHCIQNHEVKEIIFSAVELKRKWFAHNNQYEISYINRILKQSMKLGKPIMKRHIPFETNINSSKTVAGRVFIIKNKYYKKYDIDFNEETETY